MHIKKLPPQSIKYIRPFVTAAMMSFIMSGIITYKNVGFIEDFVSVWMSAWITAWVIAYPVLFVVIPIAQRVINLIVDTRNSDD